MFFSQRTVPIQPASGQQFAKMFNKMWRTLSKIPHTSKKSPKRTNGVRKSSWSNPSSRSAAELHPASLTAYRNLNRTYFTLVLPRHWWILFRTFSGKIIATSYSRWILCYIFRLVFRAFPQCDCVQWTYYTQKKSGTVLQFTNIVDVHSIYTFFLRGPNRFDYCSSLLR